MNVEKKIFLTWCFSLCAAALFFSSAVFAGDAPRITKEEARGLLGGPGVLILDARIGPAWANSDRKIKGAVRVDPSDVDSWAGSLPKDGKIIIYCS